MHIRVLQLINSLSTGGAELTVKRLVFDFDPQRVRADVVALCQRSPDAEAIFRSGFDERGLRCESLNKKTGRKDLGVLLRLIGLLRRKRYDIVHAHCYSPSIYGRLAATAVPGTKRMVTVHCRMDPNSVRVEKLFSVLTDKYVACSSETESNLRHDCGFHESRFSCILNGAGGDRTATVAKSREEIRRARGVANADTVALVLARLDEQKAQLDLLEALVQPGEQLSKLKLWLVGNDRTPYGDLVRQSVAEKKLQSRVQILGRVEDHEIDELMKGADLFLLPSLYEGMSMAILEALTAGMPTVISDLDTNREATDGGRVAWLTPPGDPVGLAAALEQVLSSPDEMKIRGKEAARYAAAKFGFDRVVREYTEAYEALVK